MIKGIIFDMDGVLVLGANKYHVEAWKKAFEEYHVLVEMMSVEEYNKLEGMRGEEIQNLIAQKNNITLEPQLWNNIYKRKKEIFAEIDNPYVPDETIHLLKELAKKGFMLAVASGNNRTVIDNFLEKYTLIDILYYTVTGDEVEKGKPDPEVFLKALQKINLPKEEVLIVENAPLGVKAAKASGVYTVAITSTVPPDLLRDADRIISHISEVKDVLQELNKEDNN